ncbi:MAG TPA: (Fe-S)-binding protein, partial [Syntrophales bacterium]|nr:(Fe-S)-binding protein [Syntrophales bacterium]
AGDGDLMLPNVLKNIETLSRAEVDAVLIDCATCGAAFKKEYVELLKRKGLDTSQAEVLQKKTRDEMEYIAERLDRLPLPKDYQGPKIRVAYHDPCHLVRVQGVSAAPREILKALPQFEYVEMEEANACCGGGGSFQFDFPSVSKGITERKIRRIRQSGARIVVSGCPGCRVTIGGNMDPGERLSVLHPLQLLYMALTGTGLERFRS